MAERWLDSIILTKCSIINALLSMIQITLFEKKTVLWNYYICTNIIIIISMIMYFFNF